jgi:4-hydroxyacetophenone monooxygenase
VTLARKEHQMQTPSADQATITMDATDAELRAALRDANLPTLLLVLTQFAGDDRWLQEPFIPSRTQALNDNDTAGFSPELQEQVRDAAHEILRGWRDGEIPTPLPPADEAIPDMLSVALGERVPPEYATTMAEEAGFHPRSDVDWHFERPEAAAQFPVVVIGAGLSGIATAVMLSRLRIPYVVIEKNPAAGGVWQENHYPGAGVDTPVHLYCYSFAPRREWSRFYARQGEIRDYIQGVASAFGIAAHTRFDSEVEAAEWDDTSQRWNIRVRTADDVSAMSARAVISCVGVLNRPFIPDFADMDVFTGRILHSARWEDDLDVTGKNVTVIGTGATAMQLVPAIAGQAAKVTVVQRSPQWVVPNENYLREVPAGARLLMSQVPFYASFYRLRLVWMFQDKLLATLRRDPAWPHPDRSINAMNEKHRLFFTQYVDEQLGDRSDLRDRVLPTYPPYGKRILMDNRWIQTVKRDDVEVVQAGVGGFDEHHVKTIDGRSHEADIVILATGFHSSQMLSPMQIRGRDGVELSEVWDDDNPFAYLGMTVPGFPNFFIIGGPNTALGHGGSAIYPAECCVAYVGQLIVRMIEDDISAVDVREHVCASYNEKVDAEHDQLIWTHPDTTVWYKNARGRVTATTPWRGVDFWEMTRTPDLSDFHVASGKPRD